MQPMPVDTFIESGLGQVNIFDQAWQSPAGREMSPEQVLKALDSHRDETDHIEAPPYATD